MEMVAQGPRFCYTEIVLGEDKSGDAFTPQRRAVVGFLFAFKFDSNSKKLKKFLKLESKSAKIENKDYINRTDSNKYRTDNNRIVRRAICQPIHQLIHQPVNRSVNWQVVGKLPANEKIALGDLNLFLNRSVKSRQ